MRQRRRGKSLISDSGSFREPKEDFTHETHEWHETRLIHFRVIRVFRGQRSFGLRSLDTLGDAASGTG